MNTKKATVKYLSVFLVVVLLAVTAAPLACAQATGGYVPSIYLYGQSAKLLSAEGEQVYPIDMPENYVKDAVKACMPTFLTALATDKWETYTEQLCGVIAPLFEDIQLNADGEIDNGSHIYWSWNRDSLPNRTTGGECPVTGYQFSNDWRLDPFENARLLHLYIQDIKAVTGADSVNLTGRCEGANIVMAYLAEYGCDDVHCISLYCPATGGVEGVGAAFSGKLRTDADAIARYANTEAELEDQILNELLLATIEMAQTTAGMNMAAGTVNYIIQRMYKAVLPSLLLCSYGTFPGIWSLIGEEDYADAVAFAFAGQEEKYAGLIEKINDYDARVRRQRDALLLDAQAKGVKIMVIAKYGLQNIPLVYANNEQSDTCSSLRASSFGATAAPIGETLPADYLSFMAQHRLDSYISCDKQVDASTCTLRDTTWIFKNMKHSNFPASIHELIRRFFYCDGNMTVFSDEAYPQFMTYEEESGAILPLREDNATDAYEAPNILAAYVRFLKAIFAFLQKYFQGMRIAG